MTGIHIGVLLNKFPNMKIIGNSKTFDMLPQFFDINVEERKVVVKEGDTVSVALNDKITHNGVDYKINPLPENLMDIINAGGLVKAMQKRNGLL